MSRIDDKLDETFNISPSDEEESDVVDVKSEIIESVDMNRFLENGVSIKMVETLLEVDAIDVPSDLVRVESKMKKDIPIILENFSSP